MRPALIIGIVALAGAASADRGDDKRQVPPNLVDRDLLLPKGMLALDGLRTGDVRMSLATTTLALDVVYAPSSRVNLALTHDRGLCLEGCAPAGPYDDVGARVDVRVLRGRVELVTRAELHLESIRRGTLDARIALLAQTRVGCVALVLAPQVSVGVTDRTTDLGPIGDAVTNPDTIAIPLEARIALFPRVALIVEAGLAETHLRGFGNAWSLEAGVGVIGAMSPWMDLGGRLVLPALIDQELDGAQLSPGVNLGHERVDLIVSGRF